jgi:iron-sulfur cluster assembly accessory protein
MNNQEMAELREFAKQADGTYHITGDMLIGDVIAGFPKAASIMLGYGLHCVGCHANVFDTVEDGARGHGLADVEILQMINEINVSINKVIETLEITPRAVAKIKELRLEEKGKEDWPLRVKVLPGDGCNGLGYEMDFDTVKETDKTFVFDGLPIIVDPESYDLLKGSSIDYVELSTGSGFKVENPNAGKACDC